MKKITLNEIKDAIKTHVEANPDYEYVGECVYWKDSAPSCLIGRALFTLGVPKETIKKLDPLHLSCKSMGIGQIRSIEILKEDGFIFDEKALSFARICQNEQDKHRKWQDVLTIAEIINYE